MLPLIFFSLFVQAKLLDKVVAVFDDQILTLSMVQRIQTNFSSRKKISPFIYTKKAEKKNILRIFVVENLIRAKLKEIGREINDQQVEEQIKATERRNNLKRADLMRFLNSQNLSFEEYFEIIRATIEYNIFSGLILAPMISINDHQIKNYYFQKHKDKKTLHFKYDIVDFTISKGSIPASLIPKLPGILTKFKKTGVLPPELKNLDVNEIGEISEEGLGKNVMRTLSRTSPESFSRPLLMDGIFHVFYLKKKMLIESKEYLKEKDKILGILRKNEMDKVKTHWIKRESQKHFIKTLLP